MSKQINILADGSYQIISTNNKTGKVEDAVTFKAEATMEHGALGRILGNAVKTAGTYRNAACSFLALVYACPKLDGYRGQGDRTTGKLSPEFKASVRSAEDIVVAQLVEEGAIKLPKGNQEEQMQAFLSGLRDDKNYSNAKNTTNKYFALVGANCATQSGYLVPVPVMQAEIAAVVDRAPVDNSVSAKLRAIKEYMADITIDAADAIDSAALLRELKSTMDGIVNQYAELATAARTGVDAAANAAIEKAANGAAPVGTRTRVAKEESATA
jgi:hypothetical protein